MDCARCSGKLKMGLFAACNIAVLAGMTVLFMNGAKNYATETLSRGGLLKSQTSFVMARQRPFPLSRSIKTTDKPTNPTPLQQDCSISPADVFKVQPCAGKMKYIFRTSFGNTGLLLFLHHT